MIGLGSDKNEYFFLMNILNLKKTIFWMNILDFLKNEFLFWMNILDFWKNEYLFWILVSVLNEYWIESVLVPIQWIFKTYQPLLPNSGNDRTLQKEVVEDNFGSDFFQHFLDPISLSQRQNHPKKTIFHSRGKVATEIGKICSMAKVEMTFS